MKIKYKGYAIVDDRHKNISSFNRRKINKIDYSITRISDNSIVNFGMHVSSIDTVIEFIKYLKEQIDDELEKTVLGD